MSRILVVDDSAMDRRLAGQLLQKTRGGEATGHAVAFAGDGKEGLEALGKEHFDLVVADLQMPHMNGLELVEAVRNQYPGVPVILMTAHGSEDIAIQALQSGAASYVPKRRAAQDLLPTVEDILALAGSRQEKQRFIEDCWTQTEMHFRLANDLGFVPALVGYLQDALGRRPVWTDNDRIRLAIALREALCNAIVHGNLEIGSELREDDEKAFHSLVAQRRSQEPYQRRGIDVIAEESRHEMIYVVRDEGRGFDPANLPDPSDPAHLERVSGRGLFLIHNFMTEVRFNQRGNEITMIKRRER